MNGQKLSIGLAVWTPLHNTFRIVFQSFVFGDLK
jgi:hypothetical protein